MQQPIDIDQMKERPCAQCAQIAKYWKKLLIWTQSDQMLESETKMFPAIRHDFNPIMLVLRF